MPGRMWRRLSPPRFAGRRPASGSRASFGPCGVADRGPFRQSGLFLLALKLFLQLAFGEAALLAGQGGSRLCGGGSLLSFPGRTDAGNQFAGGAARWQVRVRGCLGRRGIALTLLFFQPGFVLGRRPVQRVGVAAQAQHLVQRQIVIRRPA